jgi:alcohol dehydrogenase class IV
MLTTAGLKWSFLRQRNEPDVADVEGGLEQARRDGCDMVVGIGGGSAIDAAKAVAGVLSNGGTVMDYLEIVGKGRKLAKPAAPWMAIPATAGTGAEVTRNAVIACREKRFKASLRGEHLQARVALVDAELGVTVAPDVTARCGMDALCQLIESYTSDAAGPMTDALALEGIARVGRSLRRACSRGEDLDAREDLALAAMFSGIALANAGLGAVHGFAAPLGANFPVPHGVACAALLAGVMKANVLALRRESPSHPWLRRYARIGRALTWRQSGDPVAVEEGICFVEELVGALGIPPLRRFGLTEQCIPDMVALAKQTSSMKHNPVSLDDDALAGILHRAIAATS